MSESVGEDYFYTVNAVYIGPSSVLKFSKIWLTKGGPQAELKN